MILFFVLRSVLDLADLRLICVALLNSFLPHRHDAFHDSIVLLPEGSSRIDSVLDTVGFDLHRSLLFERDDCARLCLIQVFVGWLFTVVRWATGDLEMSSNLKKVGAFQGIFICGRNHNEQVISFDLCVKLDICIIVTYCRSS